MKIYAYVALAVVLLGGLKYAHSTTYSAGWNAAIVEQEAAIQDAQNEAVAKARQEWENTASIATDNIVIEERIVEVERIIEKKIPTIVERIVTVTPECNDLGPDFAGLLNEQVRAGSDRPNSGADAPPEPDP